MRLLGVITRKNPKDPENDYTGSQGLMYGQRGEEPAALAHRMVDSIKAWPEANEHSISFVIMSLDE